MRQLRWWPIKVQPGKTYEPGEALFHGLRNRLTLWYCGVLGAALVLFGIALYFGTQYALLSPIQSMVQEHTRQHVHQWVQGSPGACPPFGPQYQRPPAPNQLAPLPEIVACFDQHGSLSSHNNGNNLPQAFLSNTLALSALKQGSAEDIVNAGGTVGPIYRYALAVPGPAGGKSGVVVIGQSIKAQTDALSSLLTLLLGIGGGALLCAGLGGLFLANRALTPARLAWANQQRFIADASHELRTPLTLLHADAEVLLRGQEHLADEDVVLLKDILAETNHMTTITNNMLTLARMDSRLSHRELEVVNVAALSQQVVQRVLAHAGECSITLDEEYADDPRIIGDPMLLEQSILALLDNAIKYNRPGGQVHVRTMVQGKFVRLEVCDTGVGVAAEHVPHLGERFYRVDKARSRQAGGTGLGLSIARGIASEHGGHLTLSSVADRGTTVSLMLPVANETLSRDKMVSGSSPRFR